MLKTKLYIGIKDYKLFIPKLCVYDHDCERIIKISFKLEGDFLAAAHSDDINLSVDYEQLCNFLALRITKPEDLQINKLRSAIKLFSPLIHTGLLKLETHCAHAYLKEQKIL